MQLIRAASSDRRSRATGKPLILIDPRLTLNQRVPGASPGAPTEQIKHLTHGLVRWDDLILQVILQFCSRFELEHRSFRKLNVATKIVCIENGLDVL